MKKILKNALIGIVAIGFLSWYGINTFNRERKMKLENDFAYKEKLNQISNYYDEMFELKLNKSFAETSEEENFLWNKYYDLNRKVDSIYKLLPTDYQKRVDSIKLKEFNWDN